MRFWADRVPLLHQTGPTFVSWKRRPDRPGVVRGRSWWMMAPGWSRHKGRLKLSHLLQPVISLITAYLRSLLRFHVSFPSTESKCSILSPKLHVWVWCRFPAGKYRINKADLKSSTVHLGHCGTKKRHFYAGFTLPWWQNKSTKPRIVSESVFEPWVAVIPDVGKASGRTSCHWWDLHVDQSDHHQWIKSLL